MGFTYEHSLHHATRRLWSWREEFGNEAVWAARLGRMVAEHGLVDQVLGDGGRLVIGPGDLLDDDAALAVELALVDPRPRDEVGEQIGGREQMLGPRGDVERDQVMAGVGVEDGADTFGRLVDVAVRRKLLAAFED